MGLSENGDTEQIGILRETIDEHGKQPVDLGLPYFQTNDGAILGYQSMNTSDNHQFDDYLPVLTAENCCLFVICWMGKQWQFFGMSENRVGYQKCQFNGTYDD